MEINAQPRIPNSSLPHRLSNAAAQIHPTLPPHLVSLPDTMWSIWRWVGLRGAGCPVAYVLNLATPECPAAADRYLDVRASTAQARQTLLRTLEGLLDTESGAQAAAIARSIRRLNNGHKVESVGLGAASAAQEAYQAACTEEAAARAVFDQAYQSAAISMTRHLHAVMATDRFREALVWQNRQVLHTSVIPVLNSDPALVARTWRYRQKEAVIVNYVQRYCTKNDTIGFFGPVGWAYASDHGPAITTRPGPSLVAARTTYFETWCIDVLAETLAQDEALLPWLVPRQMPFLYVDGNTLRLPLTPPLTIPAAEAAILRACDGQRPAHAIAAAVIRDPQGELRSEAEVYAQLKRLRDMRRIVWTLEVSAEGQYPEQALRQHLERVEDEQVRSAALNVLAELEAARDRVARASGNPEQLDRAIQDLETTFTNYTNAAATRRAGSTYAGRTLVYEDCRRDVEVDLGPELIEALAPPLALLLTSARWLTYAAARVYRQAFKQIYDQLVTKTGSQTVDFASFWLLSHPLLFEESAMLDSLVHAFQERWAKILVLPPGQRQVAFTSQALRQSVGTLFKAPHPGWSSARYHSPDIMIAASGPDAIRRGDYHLVLGELHPGVNTLKTWLFVSQHPDASQLFAATLADLPPGQIALVPSREVGGATARLSTALISPDDLRFVFAHDSCGFPRERSLLTGSLVMEHSAGQLVVRCRDTHQQFDVIEVLADLLMLQLITRFSMIRPAEHTPRISIDRLVVSRETWRFAPSTLSFAYLEHEAERFLAARQWAKVHTMPRFVFVKTPVEKKPFYVDFDSIVAIDLLSKAIRRTRDQGAEGAQITISEMLPDPTQAWLTDREGQHYTCELRVVAVDQDVDSPSPVSRTQTHRA